MSRRIVMRWVSVRGPSDHYEDLYIGRQHRPAATMELQKKWYSGSIDLPGRVPEKAYAALEDMRRDIEIKVASWLCEAGAAEDGVFVMRLEGDGPQGYLSRPGVLEKSDADAVYADIGAGFWGNFELGG